MKSLGNSFCCSASEERLVSTTRDGDIKRPRPYWNTTQGLQGTQHLVFEILHSITAAQGHYEVFCG